MSITADAAVSRPAIPSIRTIVKLVIGGFAGLGVWEVFPVLASMITGQGLSPPYLVKSLFYAVLGIDLGDVGAWPTLIHMATGALFYPLGYFFLTRWIKSFGHLADAVIWGVLTTFLALGIFAPLAGYSFLLLSQGFGRSPSVCWGISPMPSLLRFFSKSWSIAKADARQ